VCTYASVVVVVVVVVVVATAAVVVQNIISASLKSMTSHVAFSQPNQLTILFTTVLNINPTLQGLDVGSAVFALGKSSSIIGHNLLVCCCI
jgi:hypothetical protein